MRGFNAGHIRGGEASGFLEEGNVFAFDLMGMPLIEESPLVYLDHVAKRSLLYSKLCNWR